MLALIAGLRATPTLNALFGGAINFFFDSHFNVSHPVSRYVQA